jgi:FkbM family methyltransferase
MDEMACSFACILSSSPKRLKPVLQSVENFILRHVPATLIGRLATFIYLRLRPDERKDVLKLSTWLKTLNIQTFIDAGAHAGQTSRAYHHALPHLTIYSFEPNQEVFRSLQSNTRSLSNIHLFNLALGEENREGILQTNVFSAGSSILPLEQLHKEIYRFAGDTYDQKITIRRLDDVAQEHGFKGPILLKMDVQGYEKQVLAGAEKTLDAVAVVIAEVCYQPLFQGQTTFADLYNYLTPRGFAYKGPFGEISRHKGNGLTLFTNAIFVKESLMPQEA